MKRNLTRIFSVTLAIVMALQLSVFAAERPTTKDRADLLAGAGISSVQYALASEGQIVLSGSAGVYSRATGEDVSSTSMYGIGSVSKMFTTTVVLKLVELGVIELDAPVVKYIPEFEMNDPRYVDITVRMLLNHSSGLMGSTMNNGMLWDDNATEAHDTLLADLKTQRLKAAPGAFSVYCNDGFSLAEILVERVTGKSFTDLIHEYITSPLGLVNTKTPLDEFDRDALVRTYNLHDPMLEMPNETPNIIGTGGVYSTASELALFGQVFTSAGTLLSEKSRDATFEKEYLNGQWAVTSENIIGYGLGWDSVDLYPFSQYGIQALCKGGDLIQYHSSLVVLPEYNLSAAVMVTAGASSSECMIIAAELLLDYLLETGEIDEILPDRVVAAAEAATLDIDTAPFAGRYASSTMGYDIVFDEQGMMSLTLPAMGGMSGGDYIYIGDSKWADETGASVMYFIEENGNTYLMQSSVAGLEGFGQTVATMYVAQKLDDYTPSSEIIDAWEARNYITYLCVNAKYSSFAYTYSMPSLTFMLDENNPGYMNSFMIVDEDTMKSVVEIPIAAGRDTMDIEVFSIDGVDYASYSDYLFISLHAIPEIYSGTSSICTIQQNGYARWYYFGAAMDGKTVNVTCKDGAGFAYYNSAGQPVNQSAVTGELTFIAQAGGFVAFIGEPGAVFTINVE